VSGGEPIIATWSPPEPSRQMILNPAKISPLFNGMSGVSY